MSIIADPSEKVLSQPIAPTTLDRARQALFTGKSQKAIQLFHSILQNNSYHVEAQHGLGLSLLQLGRTQEAAEWIAAAHVAKPDDTEILRNLGIILTRLWRLERATECFTKLVHLTLQPADMDLLGGTLCTMSRFPEGHPWLEKAEALDPGNQHRLPYLLQARAAVFQWDRYYEDRKLLEKLLKNQDLEHRLICNPFSAIILNISAESVHHLAQLEAKAATKNLHPRAHRQVRRVGKHPKRKIRLGYISPDFHCHPVGMLLAPILEAHNKLDFEVITYPLRTIRDSVRERIEHNSDIMRPMDDRDDVAIANQIAEDNIDILVDLIGFTNAARPGVLARRPAPTQIHFLGYPGTMTNSLVDYQILHHSRLGPDGFSHYDEALALLPETFIASEGFPAPEYIPSRGELGLPEDRFIFGVFGAAYRIDPAVFDAWATILQAVPDAVLWIQNGHKTAQQGMLREAEKRGIASDRMYFNDWGLLSEQWHHTHADLWLDGWHVSSGTACIISVWTGTPLLTLAGHTPQSRTGAGVLTGAKLPELICKSAEEYLQRAIHLATTPHELKSIRKKMQTQRANMPLFQVDRFTHHLELAFHTMLSKQTPHTFSVLPLPYSRNRLNEIQAPAATRG